MTSPDPILLPIKRAAALAGCSVKLLKQSANHPNVYRRLRTKRVGNRYFVTREWLTEWINRD